MEEKLILVNYDDEEIGYATKMETHLKGLLHRAFSVFIFNNERLLMQKRSTLKYHSGGKMTNSCCSHPLEGENLLDAATRRLREELGIFVNHLKICGHIVYHQKFDNGVIEYEYDHIIVGHYQGEVTFDFNEIESVEWVPIANIKKDIVAHPEKFTCWFISALTIALEHQYLSFA